MLLGEKPREGAVDALRELASTEQIEVKGNVLYLYTPDGFGRSKVAGKLGKTTRLA